MGTAKNPQEQAQEKLHAIIKGARTVLLLTHGEDHKIVGRPMSLVRVEDDETIYLVSGVDSKKVSEIRADDAVSIAIQDREGIAMIAGNAQVSQDRALVDRLWEDSWRAWFPRGKSDPDIAILVVRPTEGTYWDQDLGHGISYMFRYLKARVTGTEMETKPNDQKKVDLR